MMRAALVILIIAISAIRLTAPVTAQDRPSVQPVCAPGDSASGDLGYAATECHGCVISGRHAPGEPDMEFDAEPILSDIRAGGPADGKLQERDVLVALDGKPITARAGALQLSWLKPGQPVRVTVRRQDVLTDVEITPTARCRRVTPPRRAYVIGR